MVVTVNVRLNEPNDMALIATVSKSSRASLSRMGRSTPPLRPNPFGSPAFTGAYLSAILALLYTVEALASRHGVMPLHALITNPTTPTLYAWRSSVIALAYAPCVLVRAAAPPHPPMRARILLLSIFVVLLSAAPIGAFYRLEDEPLRLLRLFFLLAGFSGWLGALANDWAERSAGIGTVALSGALLWLGAPAAAVLAVELPVVAFLHMRLLGTAPPLPEVDEPFAPDRSCARWTWRILSVVLFPPVLAIGLAPLLTASGHAHSRHVRHRVTGYAGSPICTSSHPVLYPTSVDELRDAVLGHRSVRAVGAAHSWSPLMCPQKGGVRIATSQLRAVSVEDGGLRIRAQTGVTVGTIANELYAVNRMLQSSWHKDISVGGALACAIHHHAVGFNELVEEVTLMLANGTLLTLTNSSELWAYVPGSAGSFGFVVEVVLRTEERRAFEWTSARHDWADEDGLDALIAAWVANETLQTVLWLAPERKAATLQAMTRGPPLPAPTAAEAAAATARPHRMQDPYGSEAVVYSLYMQLWHLAISLAEPLVRTVSAEVASVEIQAAIDQYLKDEVSTPSAPVGQRTEEDVLKTSTWLATTEVGLAVDAAMLRPCVRALSRGPYAVALHLRHAQRSPLLPLVSSGEGVYNVDVSIPEALLAQLSDWLHDCDRACPPSRRDGHVVSYGHAGKGQLGSVAERRPWRAPPRARELPGSSESAAHVRYRELRDALDPANRFKPGQ